MADYSNMTTADFDRLLTARLSELSAWDIIDIPGAYELLAKHFNDDVLDDWRDQQETLADLE